MLLPHNSSCEEHLPQLQEHHRNNQMIHVIHYSLTPGVSFDLLQRLYKLEHPTVLCCSARIKYMHCGPHKCTAGLSVMITPGPQAIN